MGGIYGTMDVASWNLRRKHVSHGSSGHAKEQQLFFSCEGDELRTTVSIESMSAFDVSLPERKRC